MRILLFVLLSLSAFSQNFKSKQLKFERVANAFDKTWPALKKQIEAKGLDSDRFRIFFRIYKKEKRFEVYISPLEKEQFVLLKTYVIAASSGVLGPKRTEGDLQVPEGFYHINVFNPVSDFHLSLGVNYPNAADKIKGKKPLGGDIYIHGAEVTIGCIPLTNAKIEEVYVLAVQARANGQSKIYAHFYPFDFKTNKLSDFQKNPNYNLWKSIESGSVKFEKTQKIPFVEINQKGDYIVK